MQKNTSLTALGGIISALSVFIMFLSGIIPFLTYVIPAMSGLLLIVTIKETDIKWSFFIYVAVSILSLLVVADKEAAVMYTFFFGYYPVVKDLIDKHVKHSFRWIIKFIVFNIGVVLGYLFVIYVFGIPIDDMEEFGKYTVFVLLGLGNLTFFFYEITITNLEILYDRKWHTKIQRIFYWKGC